MICVPQRVFSHTKSTKSQTLRKGDTLHLNFVKQVDAIALIKGSRISLHWTTQRRSAALGVLSS